MGEADVFGLFVSSVEGHPVSRFGSKVLIGADRDPVLRNKIRYTPKLIVGIPTAEAIKYAREYSRAIADGSLSARKESDWYEQQRQLREVGAPREKLKSAPPTQPAKEPTHGHPEGGSKLG